MHNVILELTRITQEVAQAGSSEQQVQIVVDAISQSIQVDVCSLYLQNNNLDMVLIASHGLTRDQPIAIPAGKGLVGLVAQACHTVSLSNPEQHESYYFVPQSDEQQFHNFCGVPLVRKGQVIGVLVVQSRESAMLGAEQEAFLSTLASHLALLVEDIHFEQGLEQGFNLRHHGISGASGIAIARVKIIRSQRLGSVPDTKSDNPARDLMQWQDLKQAVHKEVQRERTAVEQSLGESLALIIDAYQSVLKDPVFDDKIIAQINAGQSLLSAIKHTVAYFSEQFLSVEDPYIRARHEDIDHLGDILYRIWLGSEREHLLEESDEPVILMGKHIGVSDIVSLAADKLVAIVCATGAALSHVAVFANALGIPAVMGIGEIKSMVDGELLIVDGNIGQIIRRPSEMVITEYQNLISSNADFDQSLQALAKLPAITTDGVSIELFANSGLQADVKPGIRNGADGIGLYRTEVPFMVRSSLPSEAEQVEEYQQVFRAYSGKPVYIRTLDIGGDKPLEYLPAMKEENPALGWRGIRFTLDNLQLMMTQLRAIVRAADGAENIHILLPMVSSTRELDSCISLLDEVCKQLRSEGIAIHRPKMGIMVEVPAVIPLLQFWHKKLDFISIGTNDLSQYLLAIDRNSPLVGKLHDSLHPAVIHELNRIVKIAEKYSLPLCLCGEMASNPVAVMLLVGMGIRRLSLSSSKLPLIKWILRAMSIDDAEKYTRQALTMDNAEDIRRQGILTLASLGVETDRFLR